MIRILNWLGGKKGKGAGFSLLSIGNLLIAFLTYLRFAEIAQIFGTTWQTDAVSIAMVIPLLLQQLISTAFGSVFIPVYSKVQLDKGKDAADRLISRVINWMVLSGFFLICLVLFSGSFFIRIVGPGVNPSTTELATRMLWILLPLIFLNAVEGVLQHFLIYGNRYGLVSFVRVLQILVSYLVVVFGHDKLGIMIVPVSGLVGALVSFLVCAVFTFRLHLKLYAVMNPGESDFKEMIRLAIPITVGVMTGFLAPVADKALASFLQASSVTAIDYAARIKNLLRVILIQPVIILSTVSFSKLAAERNMPALRREIASYINYISFYAVPVAGAMVIMAVPFISIMFQRGNFGPEQTKHVGYALTYYSPWFAQFGIGLIVRRAFFSIRETVAPVVIGICAAIANVLLNIILIGPMGIGGLALATTLTSTAKNSFQMYLLRKRIHGVNGSAILPEFLKTLAATAVMMGYLILSSRLFPIDLYGSLSDRILRLMAGLIPAAAIYIGAMALLKSKVYRNLLNRIKSYCLKDKRQ